MSKDKYARFPSNYRDVENYRYMGYNAANNALAHVPQKISRYKKDEIANTLIYTKRNFILKIDGTDETIPQSALQLLDFIWLEFTKKGNSGEENTIEITFDDYADFRGVRGKQNRWRLRRQMIDDLDMLYRLSIEWSDKKRENCIKSRIIYKTEISETKRNMTVSLVPEFARYSFNGKIMLFDTRLGALDGRNPNVRNIGRKLLEHYSIIPNRKVGTHNILSLKSLLAAAPDIPTEEEVRTKYNRDYVGRIIKPFENAIEELESMGTVKEWYWLTAKREPLEQYALDHPSWNNRKNCKIRFELYDISSQQSQK